MTAGSHGHPEEDEHAGHGRIAAPITALDGREFGSIELACHAEGEFTDIDQAVLAQLAQMASARSSGRTCTASLAEPVSAPSTE